MTTTLDFAKEMKPLIDQIFDLESDEEQRYDRNSIWNLEAMKNMENDGKTYYQTFRKIVFGKRWEGDKRIVEIRIERYKLIDQDKVLKQDIWVYEKDMNKNLENGRQLGTVINGLSFSDYCKNTRKASYYSDKFPLFVPNKARLRDEARYAKAKRESELKLRKKEEKEAKKAQDAKEAMIQKQFEQMKAKYGPNSLYQSMSMSNSEIMKAMDRLCERDD
jgi:hypothetical protein